MKAVINTVAWFGSLLLSVTLFSEVYGFYAESSFKFVFHVTMIFALPVAILYPPIVFYLKDAEEGRMKTLLGVGLLIGPVALVMWSAIQHVVGNPSNSTSHDIGLGLLTCLCLSFIVGSMTTAFYVTALKASHRVMAANRDEASQEKGRS